LSFLMGKYTIWQPWMSMCVLFLERFERYLIFIMSKKMDCMEGEIPKVG
jgi:hypothetical protein